MRAPGLLLPLLLLGVSSQDPPASLKGDVTTGAPKSQEATTATTTGKTLSASQSSPSISHQTTISTAKPETSLVTSLTTAKSTTPADSLRSTSSIPSLSTSTVQGVTTTNNKNTSAAPSISSHVSQQDKSSASSRAPSAAPAATSSAAQQQTSPSLSSLGVTTVSSTVPTHVSLPGASDAAKTSSPSRESQGNQSLDHSTSTTGVLRISTTPGPSNQSIPSSTSVTTQTHSFTSPDKELVSTTKPGSISASASPLNESLPLTTSKTALTSSPGRTHGVSEAATTTAPLSGEPDKSSHRTTPAQPTSTSWSSASALPSTTAQGDQRVPSSPGQQHPNISFQNEVICKDQMQNNGSTMYLKEAKTCDEWRMASNNISFFESFCSTGQHTFNPSRERCTVTLMSPEPRSHQWAVSAVLHLPLDADNVLKHLKDNNKFEELGIANITDKTEREMIINDEFSTPLIITIVTLAGSLLLVAAIYGCCHQRFSQKKDQHIHPDLPGFDDGHVALIFNRLTEELQTMENGYHDNPTLEVMETSSEMQEKKVNLNGELGDSWIVPLDTLMKEDLEEEEDTHL